MAKVLVLLSANSGARGDLIARAKLETSQLRANYSHGNIQLLTSLDNDPLASTSPSMQPADVTIEINIDLGRTLHTLAQPLRNIAALFSESLDRSKSIVLAGHDRLFLPHAPQPICYRYLIKRRADFFSADYLDYYAKHHSQFATWPGAAFGYTQFYVDRAASQYLAEITGLTYQDFDSVSEIYIPSLEEFFSATMASENAHLAPADEEVFVDRPASLMFCSRYDS